MRISALRFDAAKLDQPQNLLRVQKAEPGLRILPGSIFGVPQAIIVPAKRTERLAAVNKFLSEARQSGFLQSAIDRANNGTEIEPAPAGR